MATRQPNYRLVKIHRNYTVERIAEQFGVHRNTVRQWIKQGLPKCNDTLRPILIRGIDLADFLKARRLKNRRPCRPGQIYCVRCRDARTPAKNVAVYCPLTATQGDLVGVCPHCDCRMFRRVSYAKIAEVCGELDVTMAEPASRIGDCPQPSVNSDFEREP